MDFFLGELYRMCNSGVKHIENIGTQTPVYRLSLIGIGIWWEWLQKSRIVNEIPLLLKMKMGRKSRKVGNIGYPAIR